jgi:hypothetical protein
MDPTSAGTGPARFWVFALIAVLVTAGVAVGIVVFSSDGDGAAQSMGTSVTPTDNSDVGPSRGSTGDDGGTAEPLSAEESSAEAEIAELSAAASSIRGLPFLEPVETTFLSDDDFRQRVLDQLDEDLDPAELAEIEMIWQALGLIDADLSLEAALRDAFGEAVLGFYNPETDELVVRGVVLDPLLRSTLVHELTHALDDQHFDIERAELMDGEDTEAQFGFIGLVEGTASWVEDQWVAGLSDDELLALREAEARFGAGIDYSDLPETLLIDISLPYIFGPELVRTIVERGGTDGIDAAYLDPPSTGEHLFDPLGYLESDDPVRVPAPPADGEVLVDGVVGASGFYEMLLWGDPSNAGRMATDWGGDHFVVWRDDPDVDRACLRVDMVGDRAEDTDRAYDALQEYARVHGDATAERVDGRVRLTACG